MKASRVFALGALLVFGGGLSGGEAPAPGGGVEPGPVVWTLTSTDLVGGAKPEVAGAPRALTAEEGGPGLWFDGAADGLWLPLNPLADRARFTVEVLVRPEAGGPDEQRFLHVEDAQGNRALIELRVLAGGTWCVDTFLRTPAGQRALIDREKRHPLGRWTWVALVYDGRTMAHFVDGVKELEGPVAFASTGPGRTSLGVRQNRVYWFRGAIREVRIHPDALPAGKLRRAE